MAEAFDDPREKLLAAIGTKVTTWFRCPKCGESGGIDVEQALGRVSIVCPTEGCDFHETGAVEPVIFADEPLTADQQFTVGGA